MCRILFRTSSVVAVPCPPARGKESWHGVRLGRRERETHKGQAGRRPVALLLGRRERETHEGRAGRRPVALLLGRQQMGRGVIRTSAARLPADLLSPLRTAVRAGARASRSRCARRGAVCEPRVLVVMTQKDPQRTPTRTTDSESESVVRVGVCWGSCWVMTLFILFDQILPLRSTE